MSENYRAAERTFQLLTQAAGRAGRGNKPGEVVIQTYDPEHYSIETAKAQDYDAFYEQEIAYRKIMLYPPVWNMLVILCASKSEEAADAMAAEPCGGSGCVYRAECGREGLSRGTRRRGDRKSE